MEKTMQCTHCKKMCTHLTYDVFTRISGVTARVIPEGQKWCSRCCAKAGIKTLAQINRERQKSLS